jgi:hypothetical protein
MSFVEGELVHTFGRMPVTIGMLLIGCETIVLTENLGWRIDNKFHVRDADGNLVFEPDGMTC